jgi:hypothetical protein
LVASEQQLDVLDTADPGETRALAEAAKLTQTREGEGVESIEDVNTEEKEALADGENSEDLTGIEATVGDAALFLGPEEAFNEAAAMLAQLFISGDRVRLDKGVKSRHAMNEVAPLVENQFENFCLDFPGQFLKSKWLSIPWCVGASLASHFRGNFRGRPLVIFNVLVSLWRLDQLDIGVDPSDVGAHILLSAAELVDFVIAQFLFAKNLGPSL